MKKHCEILALVACWILLGCGGQPGADGGLAGSPAPAPDGALDAAPAEGPAGSPSDARDEVPGTAPTETTATCIAWSRDAVPTLLSETGCVDPQDPTRMAAGLIPFSPNAPMFTDGADKERWMGIPPGDRIEMDDRGDFDFPVGTVLVKSFTLNGRRLETRLLVQHEDGWVGYPYRWNDEGTEAMLVLSGDKVEGAHADGTDWTIPSSVSCTQCHNAESGFALGLELAQLNGPLEHGSDVAAADQYGNQMEMLEALGVIEPLDFPTDSMPTMVDPWDEEAPLEDRARAYLHSNCGSCHTAPENVCSGDLRWSADLARMGVCNVEPKIKLEEWAPGTMLLAPGQPERSAILFHMNAEQETGAMPMPPLGRDHVDREGTMLIRDWIASLEGCE